MQLLISYIPLAQILVSVLLIASVLLQQRGNGLGSSFGGDGSSFFATRRGIQQKLHVFTWLLGGLFIALALLNLLV